MRHANRNMKVGLLLAAVLTLAAGSGTPADAAVKIDPLLSEVLATADPGSQVQAILTFSTRPSTLELTSILATGVKAVRLRVLPMVAIQGTPLQVRAVTLLSLTRLVSVYANRRLEYYLDESVSTIQADQVWNSLGYTGNGVTVAVLDSGIDGTHPDLTFGGKVVQNVKIVTTAIGVGNPVYLENLAITDTTSGHGTHVASTIAGTGSAAGSRYTGVAPGASLVGLGAGEAIVILGAVEGFDWILANRAAYGIRVVSNSWGTEGAFDPNDPVSVASKAVHDAGIVVVFAAGNSGPGNNTLNPYSVAPWVIGVAAGNKDGSTLADFSSRGIPGNAQYHPTVTAPGVAIVAARSTTGTITLPGLPDDVELGTDALRYTTMSGTSMATPHVAGVVALMLEANPSLTPDQVKQALVGTATPMPGYQQHEVGAGYVDALAAVLSVQ